MKSNPGSQVAEKVANPLSHWPMPGANDLLDYWADAWQRSILLLDVLRQRGNNCLEHNARTAPNVLSFDVELVLDGRSLPRPVNYGLVRIIAPQGTATDPSKRTFIVFDPRAGHGPGIGGMKHDSEIGVAVAAGHPCYFVGFLPDPVPGQTIEDVCEAEARFVEEVVKRHPNAEGKPCLIGNCQAGWQIMMMAAIHSEKVGPIMLAGSPLSYWTGVHGKNPMRYLGGLLGGTWLTSLAGDLGNGIFDGANLVANFESLHQRSTRSRRDFSNSRNGGAARYCSMPGRCRRSLTSCLSGTGSPPATCVAQTVFASTCAISTPRLSYSAPGVTTSRRHSRHCTGSSIFTITRTRSLRQVRRSSIACIRVLAISASLSRGRSRPRSMASSRLPTPISSFLARTVTFFGNSKPKKATGVTT